MSRRVAYACARMTHRKRERTCRRTEGEEEEEDEEEAPSSLLKVEPPGQHNKTTTNLYERAPRELVRREPSRAEPSHRTGKPPRRRAELLVRWFGLVNVRVQEPKRWVGGMIWLVQRGVALSSASVWLCRSHAPIPRPRVAALPTIHETCG